MAADPKDPKSEEKGQGVSQDEQVAKAYENISRKLEDIRNGKTPEDDDSEEEPKDTDGPEEELEEWKGPKGVAHPAGSGQAGEEETDEEEEEKMELRRVKLKNLEDLDSDEAMEEHSSEDQKEEEPEEDEQEKVIIKEANKDWKPQENDPLDQDESDEDELKLSSDEDELKLSSDEEDEDEKPESAEKDIEEDIEDEKSERKPTGEEPLKQEAESESELPIERSSQPDTLDDLAEDDYSIPNLRRSRQEGSNIGYNAPSETDLPERGYHNKSNMENNDPNIFFSSHNQPALPKRANKFHLLILVVIGIFVIGFTVYILKGGFGDIGGSLQPSPSPSEQPTPTPTPTPTPVPERSKYKVRVLNGSGKTGLAKTVSDKLKELGYQIDKTGNATNSAFTQTIIRVKTDSESFIPQVVKDLTPDFDGAGNTSLKDDDTVDIEIILGAK